MKKWITFHMFVCFLLILTSCGNNEMNEQDITAFTIGVIPVQTEGAMDTAIKKLQSTLSEQLKREVKIDVYPDYNGVVEAMNYDKIDMAYFGPLTYVIAHEKSGAKAIITQLINGEPFYHSYIITNTENPWESLEELISAPDEIDFAFGDINSTSGSLIPSIELQDRGMFVNEDEHSFKTVRYTGSHDATALAVQNKLVDAGAIDSAIFNQLVESGKVDGEQIKIIWQSEKLFQYPWAVHKDTDNQTIQTLQETFKSINDQEILDAFGATGFTEATNGDYESIRKAAIKQGIINE